MTKSEKTQVLLHEHQNINNKIDDFINKCDKIKMLIIKNNDLIRDLEHKKKELESTRS